MKKIILLIFVIFIIRIPLSPPTTCDIRTAKQAIPPKIFFESSIDGSGQDVYFTRFIHNKVGIFSHEFATCYFNLIDFNFLTKNLSLFGLATWFVFIYRQFIKKQYLVFELIIPALPFFLVPAAYIVLIYKIFAIIGLSILLKLKK